MDAGNRAPLVDSEGGFARLLVEPRRSPTATVAVTVVLTAATALLGLVLGSRISLGPGAPAGTGTAFYVVTYHYGFAFYDQRFTEVERIEVREGEPVTLHIVPAQALARETFLAFNARSARLAVGGLPAGDPRVPAKIAEDLQLGNVEHIIGIAAHPVYVTTTLAALLDGKAFRDGAPRTVREAVERRDPAIKTVTFTAKKVGAYDVLCVDSGMDGSGTCGWGHKWMVAKEAFVVRP